MADAMLTKARQAVWKAVEEWPPLQGKLQRVWKFEDSSAMQGVLEPTIGDLPALAIYPSHTPAAEWVVHQTQRIPYTLELKLWTRNWTLYAGEWLWEEIVRALFQSAAPGQATHIFLGTGHNGVDLGPLAVQRTRLGEKGPAVTTWQWSITLRIHWNPSL